MPRNRLVLGCCYLFLVIIVWCIFVDSNSSNSIVDEEHSERYSNSEIRGVKQRTTAEGTTTKGNLIKAREKTTVPTPENKKITIQTTSKPERSDSKTYKSLPFQDCVLPKNDPFDVSLRKHIDIRFDVEFRKSCSKDFKVLTTLKDGKITVSDDGLSCQGRCFRGGELYHSDNVVDEWMNIEDNVFDCEFVEVECRRWSLLPPEYTMLHTQINSRTNTSKNGGPKKSKQPNVYVFLIDSVSTGSAERYLQRTLRYMEKSMDAVQFNYINRVGLNSRPNALALFYGKSVEPVERTAMGMKTIPSDWDWWTACKRFLDNETSIFHDFKAGGYTTLLTDDWHEAILNYPDCKGLEHPIMDHTLDPFIMQSYTPTQKKNFHGNNCVFLHKKTLEYTKQLMEAYPNNPHFFFNWITQVTHENQAGPVAIDADLLEFLYENKPLFDESFVIFMSDHGCRGCSITQEELGKVEFNNPFFIMSVPKELRTPEILGTLKENAGKLQTHYDTRATLLDILKFQPASNFADRNPIEIPGEKGNSFLRRQTGERSCRTLPIPFVYCMCEYPMETMDNSSDEANEVGQAIINTANKRLTDAGLDSKCNLWKFSKVGSIVGFAPVSQTGAMKVVAGVSWPYEEANFVTLVQRSKNGSLTIGSLDRVDRYWSRGGCVLGPLQPLCDCKDQQNIYYRCLR